MGNNMEMSDKGAKWGLTQSSGLELHMVGHAAAMHTLDQQALLSNSLKLTNCKLAQSSSRAGVVMLQDMEYVIVLTRLQRLSHQLW